MMNALAGAYLIGQAIVGPPELSTIAEASAADGVASIELVLMKKTQFGVGLIIAPSASLSVHRAAAAPGVPTTSPRRRAIATDRGSTMVITTY